MPKISEAAVGRIIHIDETINSVVTPTPFIYLGQDESGNCICLRKEVAAQRRMHGSNVAVYDGCEADLWLENEETGYLSRFDAVTRACFVPTQLKLNSIESGGIVAIARRCFTPTYTQMGYATTPDEGASFLEALKTAAGTTNANTARIAYNASQVAVYWWLSSAGSEAQFRYVSSNGNASSSNASNGYNWLRPALSVSPDTIVSDLESETVYLLPDSTKLYREAAATIRLGSAASRPKQARVMVDAQNCDTLQLWVSNNAGDAKPMWVEVENGGVVNLPNTTKETESYELGVKIYATSPNKAVIGEPVVIVLEDEVVE